MQQFMIKRYCYSTTGYYQVRPDSLWLHAGADQIIELDFYRQNPNIPGETDIYNSVTIGF